MSVSIPSRCRYCGGNTKVSGKVAKGHCSERSKVLYYVMCNSCKMRGPIFKGNEGEYENGAWVGGEDEAKVKAIEAWNLLNS